MSSGETDRTTRTAVLVHLSRLVGSPLSAARRSVDMRTLQFGALRKVDRGSVGEFALHIQCPWRIDGPDGIVTGRMDLYEPIERGPDFDGNNWDYETCPNLQDSQFDQLLARYRPGLVVVSIEADDCGGAAIHFREQFCPAHVSRRHARRRLAVVSPENR